MPISFSIYRPMFSGSDDAEGRVYKMLIGRSRRRWLVALQENAADNIYVEGGPNSDGFGGRTLTFPLEDGGEVSLKGPWKSNVGDLLKDTGYDLRDKFLTRGIIAHHRIYGNVYSPDFYVGILHYDTDPVLGRFDRIKRLAQMYADQQDRRVVYGVISHGGGSAGFCDPAPATETAA